MATRPHLKYCTRSSSKREKKINLKSYKITGNTDIIGNILMAWGSVRKMTVWKHVENKGEKRKEKVLTKDGSRVNVRGKKEKK